MDKMTVITSIPAPLPEDNIDTDAIFPARFLLLLDKAGIGKYLFNERKADKDFVLNIPPYDSAKVLVTGARFGIGSSREHAAWALADFGIRCIIAPSFGDIFFANCIKNGILPIGLGPDEHAKVMAAGEAKLPVRIDLPGQTVSIDGSEPIPFTLKAYHKESLMQGLDEIDGILKRDIEDIEAFEARQKQEAPWLYLTGQQHSIFDERKHHD